MSYKNTTLRYIVSWTSICISYLIIALYGYSLSAISTNEGCYLSTIILCGQGISYITILIPIGIIISSTFVFIANKILPQYKKETVYIIHSFIWIILCYIVSDDMSSSYFGVTWESSAVISELMLGNFFFWLYLLISIICIHIHIIFHNHYSSYE